MSLRSLSSFARNFVLSTLVADVSASAGVVSELAVVGAETGVDATALLASSDWPVAESELPRVA